MSGKIRLNLNCNMQMRLKQNKRTASVKHLFTRGTSCYKQKGHKQTRKKETIDTIDTINTIEKNGHITHTRHNRNKKSHYH